MIKREQVSREEQGIGLEKKIEDQRSAAEKRVALEAAARDEDIAKVQARLEVLETKVVESNDNTAMEFKSRPARTEMQEQLKNEQVARTYLDDRLAAVERRMQDGIDTEKTDRQSDVSSSTGTVSRFVTLSFIALGMPR